MKKYQTNYSITLGQYVVWNTESRKIEFRSHSRDLTQRVCTSLNQCDKYKYSRTQVLHF